MKKGEVLQFKDRAETIIKASNNRLRGEIVTNANTYSTDFIMRWLEFGFVKIGEKRRKTEKKKNNIRYE